MAQPYFSSRLNSGFWDNCSAITGVSGFRNIAWNSKSLRSNPGLRFMTDLQFDARFSRKR
jgi:hypothetical protein